MEEGHSDERPQKASSKSDQDLSSPNNSGQIISASGQALTHRWLAVIAAIWTGQAFSIISSNAAGYAIIWYVTETTGSSLILSLMMICAMLPTGLLAPFGGILADRYNRKAIMILSDLSIGALSVLLGIMMLFGEVSIAIIILFAAARSVGQAFHSPAFMAAIPMLVPDKHLLRINMLDQLVVSISQVASPALGIFVYMTFGLPVAMFMDALGAVFAVAGLLFAHIPTVRDETTDNQHVIRNLRDGWRAIATNRGLLELLLIMLVGWIAMAPVVAIFPLMTYDHFNGDGYMASLVEAAYGGGLVAGSVILLAWGGGKRLARLITVCYLVSGTTMFICGITPTDMFWLFVLMNVLCGLFLAGFNGPIMTLVQRKVSSEKLGRAMGLISACTGIGAPLGIAIGGPFGDVIGVANLVAICGAICIATSIAALIPKSIRALDEG